MRLKHFERFPPFVDNKVENSALTFKHGYRQINSISRQEKKLTVETFANMKTKQ